MGMRYKENVIAEISETLDLISEENKNKLIDYFDSAKRIFIYGAGRSGLVMRAFAMRLMHLGYNVHVVGDVTTPSINAGDIFLVGSSSGEKGMALTLSQKVKSLGIPVILISTNTDCSISKIADLTIKILAPTKRPDNPVKSIQPPGSRFEQSLWIFSDLLVLEILDKRSLTVDYLRSRHTNLE